MGEQQGQRATESDSVPGPEREMRSSAEWSKPAMSFPRYLTTFIGREQERRDIRSLLVREDVHLLTLLGPGGSGKTRLAVETSSDVASEFTHGTVFISFESLRVPDMLIPAIAQALGVHLVRTCANRDSDPGSA